MGKTMGKTSKIIITVFAVLVMAGCVSKNLSDEKSRSQSETKQLRDRLSTSQIDR
jgi:hypothetical protein